MFINSLYCNAVCRVAGCYGPVVGVSEGVSVTVGLGVAVGVSVEVEVAVGEGVMVAVAVGGWALWRVICGLTHNP